MINYCYGRDSDVTATTSSQDKAVLQPRMKNHHCRLHLMQYTTTANTCQVSFREHLKDVVIEWQAIKKLMYL